jgi:hypothetical protein
LLFRHSDKKNRWHVLPKIKKKGESMSQDDARIFVAKMREDDDFRKMALESSSQEDLSLFLHSKGLRFDQRELVGAMAECMAQLEQQMSC